VVTALRGGFSLRTVRNFARHCPGDRLERSGDPAERVPEVRQIDYGEQKARYPEDVHVREEGDQAEDGDDLELEFMSLVGDALGKRMQPEEENSDGQHGPDQEQCHEDHETVGLTGSSDERRQMVGSGRM
jgi:hypothetical protein